MAGTKPVRMRKGAKAAAARDLGRITVKAPKPSKDFSAPRSSRITGLREPELYGYVGVGQRAYRDATPGLWGGKLFGPPLSSPNREINPNRRAGVANAREADRNHPFVTSGITKRAVNTVGAALRLQYLPNWAALGVDPKSPEAIEFVQQIENHFSLWGEDHRFLADAQRQGQFGANMLLACREALGTEGETLVISRYDEDRMNAYRADYATFIEVVSVDRLSNPDWYTPQPGKPIIYNGKELDAYGAAVAFHVLTVHPADNIDGTRIWERVVRETDYGRPVGIHWFPRMRAGMQRAMPAIIGGLRTTKMWDRFNDAELGAAVLEAIFSMYVKSPATAQEVLQRLQSAAPTAIQDPLVALFDKRFDYYEENGIYADGVRIPVLPPGDELAMATTSRAAQDKSDFRSAMQRELATMLNQTYEQFSGDYSQTTFSSARAAIIDIWRLVTVDRILFTQHVGYPIFAAFIEEVYLRADELGIDWPAEWPDFYEKMTAYTQCEFRGPGMGWVDPQKDVTAAGMRVEQGLTSPTLEAAQQGQDFRDNVDQIARDFDYARSKGVALPGMPEYAQMTAPPPPANGNGQDGTDGNDGSSSDANASEPPANEDKAKADELERQENRL